MPISEISPRTAIVDTAAMEVLVETGKTYWWCDCGLSKKQPPEAPAEFEIFMRTHADASWKTGLALGTADARQAIKLVRQRAHEWSVNPNRIRFMGISMGGFLTTNVVLNHHLDGRPNFAAAIYGGEAGGHPVPSDAPPLFAVAAQDDELGMAGKVASLYQEWNAAKIPADLHVFARGGRGFGAIKQGLPVDGWLEPFAGWLSSQQFLPTTRNERH
jgi:dienelactone hydrolase